MFENAKIGDTVWSCLRGPAEIVGIAISEPRYMKLQFELEGPKIHAYLLTGKCQSSDLFPEIYWRAFKPPPKAMKPPVQSRYQWLYYVDNVQQYHLTTGAYVTREEVRVVIGQYAKPLRPIKETKQVTNEEILQC